MTAELRIEDVVGDVTDLAQAGNPQRITAAGEQALLLRTLSRRPLRAGSCHAGSSIACNVMLHVFLGCPHFISVCTAPQALLLLPPAILLPPLAVQPPPPCRLRRPAAVRRSRDHHRPAGRRQPVLRV